MTLEVSYPPRVLNPNVRDHIHWSKVSGPKKRYRNEVTILARDAIRRGLIALPDTERIGLKLDFHPPWPPRGRDDDNAESSFKVGRDALAKVLGIDDKRFVVSKTLHKSTRERKHGCVLIELTAVS